MRACAAVEDLRREAAVWVKDARPGSHLTEWVEALRANRTLGLILYYGSVSYREHC